VRSSCGLGFDSGCGFGSHFGFGSGSGSGYDIHIDIPQL
jgi:hypothetical protein